MKILYLIHKLELPCHQYIIDFLIENGVQVVIEPIGPAPAKRPWIDVWSKIKGKAFIDECKKANYDFIVSNTHSSYIASFATQVTPKYGYIDIEHDLFSYRPENFKGSFILACHEKHSNWCEANDRRFARCRWPKLDAPYTKTDLTIDKFKDAIFVGSYVFKKINKSINKFGFDNLWWKKYQHSDPVIPGYQTLPPEFDGPIGIRNFTIAKFIITQQSSCFIEALMLGILPIILPAKINKSIKIDDILNAITIKNKPGVGTISAITTDNIQAKINLLKDEALYQTTLEKMRADWLCDDYFSLPSAKEAMWNYIQERANG